jgi:hypothetical protein
VLNEKEVCNSHVIHMRPFDGSHSDKLTNVINISVRASSTMLDVRNNFDHNVNLKSYSRRVGSEEVIGKHKRNLSEILL